MDLILDIETIPLDEEAIMDMAPPFDPDKVALGNAKKADTVEKIIEEARLAYPAKIMEGAALDPRYSKLALCGLYWCESGTNQLEMLQGDENEADALTRLWKSLIRLIGVENGSCIGFGIKHFDIPYCVQRSWMLGIRVDWTIFNPRSRFPIGNYAIDLQEVMSMGDYRNKFMSLDEVSKAYKLLAKTGKGKDFPGIVEEGPCNGNGLLPQRPDRGARLGAESGASMTKALFVHCLFNQPHTRTLKSYAVVDRNSIMFCNFDFSVSSEEEARPIALQWLKERVDEAMKPVEPAKPLYRVTDTRTGGEANFVLLEDAVKFYRERWNPGRFLVFTVLDPEALLKK